MNKIEEFFNIPYELDRNNNKIIKLTDVFLIIKHQVDQFTMLNFAFILGNNLKDKARYRKTFDATFEDYYLYNDIKHILNNNYDGSYTLWQRLQTGREEIFK